jgi:hypothetical protein
MPIHFISGKHFQKWPSGNPMPKPNKKRASIEFSWEFKNNSNPLRPAQPPTKKEDCLLKYHATICDLQGTIYKAVNPRYTTCRAESYTVKIRYTTCRICNFMQTVIVYCIEMVVLQVSKLSGFICTLQQNYLLKCFIVQI